MLFLKWPRAHTLRNRASLFFFLLMNRRRQSIAPPSGQKKNIQKKNKASLLARYCAWAVWGKQLFFGLIHNNHNNNKNNDNNEQVDFFSRLYNPPHHHVLTLTQVIVNTWDPATRPIWPCPPLWSRKTQFWDCVGRKTIIHFILLLNNQTSAVRLGVLGGRRAMGAMLFEQMSYSCYI